MFIMPENTEQREPQRPCTKAALQLFFPQHESQHPGHPTRREQRALQVCALCPATARAACLDDALRFQITDQYGIVGGTTSADRKAIIRARTAPQLAAVA